MKLTLTKILLNLGVSRHNAAYMADRLTSTMSKAVLKQLIQTYNTQGVFALA